MSEARSVRDFGIERILLESTLDAYQLIQCPSGKAGYYNNGIPKASGEYADLQTSGTATITKTAGFKGLKGGDVWWDHSANAASYKKVNDRDFYVGRWADDCESAATAATVLLNEDPRYDIDLVCDPFNSVLVGTPAAGGFGYPVRLGGTQILELTATNEAQKVDLLSVDGFSKNANAIVEFAFRILNDGSNATQDFTIGVASGTHASDFQSVAEFVAVSTVGNSTNLNVQSDDGTTDVAPTDSTADYTEGSAVSNRVEGWADFRNPDDVQVYINGTLVLSGSTFTLNGGSATLFLIAHLEKTSSSDVYKVAIDKLRARFCEQ